MFSYRDIVGSFASCECPDAALAVSQRAKLSWSIWPKQSCRSRIACVATGNWGELADLFGGTSSNAGSH